MKSEQQYKSLMVTELRKVPTFFQEVGYLLYNVKEQ